MNQRTFRAARYGGQILVHDPATGFTHRPDRDLPEGRILLAPEDVSGWPIADASSCPGPVPFSLCWSPLVRCNLSCPHCLDDTSVPEAGRQARGRTAALIADSGVMGVDISGGEPLLLADLADLAETLRGKGCVVSVTTNGWHLHRHATALADHLDAIRVSLDGPTAALHDAWHGEDSFDRALAGIRAALAAGLRVQIQNVLMVSTQPHAQAMVELAARLGVGGVTFLQMLPIGEGAHLGGREMLLDEDAETIVGALAVPDGLVVRLRTRASAGVFTVIRADGRIWRNTPSALEISALNPLREPEDLMIGGRS